ncbi:MAG: FAD-dependent oxidoreductase [Synechococcaceae cyanobacterium]|nr:FAD-dependent oxidoreductase [Synechococcaceae cyanobacterium]
MTAAATPPSDAVLILGGGLMGLALAHQLARRGQSVLVLSRRRSEAAGFVAAGMLAPHAEGLGGALLSLGQASLARISDWVAGIEADSALGCGLRTCGIVVPFATAAERDAFPTAAWGTALERPALEREIPGIGPLWRAGLLFEQDGQIDNRRRLMRALERACVQRGVRFEEGSEVLELITRPGATHPVAPIAAGRAPGPAAEPASPPRLEAVRLRRADGSELTLACRRAVLTCGAWSARQLPQLPVFPVKGQMLSLQGPIGALQRVVFGPGTYLVPREDGLLVVGATSEPEAGFSEGLTPFGQQRLEAGIAALLPEASGWPPMERWWGFRPCTPDQGPLLGPGPIDGLWLCTGHHRNGVLLAAISAELLAVSLGVGSADAVQARLLEGFSWRRFRDDARSGAPTETSRNGPPATSMDA